MRCRARILAVLCCSSALAACTQPAAPVMDHSASDYGKPRSSLAFLKSAPQNNRLTVASYQPASYQTISSAAPVGSVGVRDLGASALPPAKGPFEVKSAKKIEADAKAISASMIKESAPEGEGAGFIWPVEGGKVISSFGPKSGGMVNDGINIAASEGEPVSAASGGTVAYAGNQIQGYGNMVLIKHAQGKSTTYAHLSKIAARQGARVQQGDIIGYVGSSGNVQTSQLHFSIRDGKKPVNPARVLPHSLASAE